MPVIKYHFQTDLFRDQKTKKLGTVYRPYARVKLGYGKKWSEKFIRALIDSGADTNVFPASFATEIGIDYKKGTLKKITGIGGYEVESYINLVKLKIEDKQFETVIEFSESIQIPLLGREGFFNYFSYIKLRVKKRLLELKY